MRSRFARPDTTVLHLSTGDTLTVKRRLNAVASRVMRARKQIATLAEPAVVMAYLVDWTLVDDAGQLVPIAGVSDDALAHAIDALDEDAFDEVYAAIAAHVKAMEAERAVEKNGKGGEMKSPATSPSRSEPAGALSGSVS
jgi:hypothetical protein